MPVNPFVLFLLAVMIFLAACSGDPGTGPKEAKWDRDACERCRMILSDRHFAAQIRYLPAGNKRTKVLWFDDIGCATLWLRDKTWKDGAGTEIWVTDHLSGEWIDARKATYIKGKITPMVFGLGAQLQPAEGGLDFAQAQQHIIELEARFNNHSMHLLDRFRERAKMRESNLKAQPQESPLPPIIPSSKAQ